MKAEDDQTWWWPKAIEQNKRLQSLPEYILNFISMISNFSDNFNNITTYIKEALIYCVVYKKLCYVILSSFCKKAFNTL